LERGNPRRRIIDVGDRAAGIQRPESDPSGASSMAQTFREAALRQSIRDDREYLGIPDDGDEELPRNTRSSKKSSSFFDRFRSSRRAAPPQEQRRGLK
jgi:hypothetical protein